jgi:hypothetical protein
VRPTGLSLRAGLHTGVTYADARALAAETPTRERRLVVVRRADAAVVEDTREGRPAREHVVNGLCDGIVPREFGAFGAHPLIERGDEGRAPSK